MYILSGVPWLRNDRQGYSLGLCAPEVCRHSFSLLSSAGWLKPRDARLRARRLSRVGDRAYWAHHLSPSPSASVYTSSPACPRGAWGPSRQNGSFGSGHKGGRFLNAEGQGVGVSAAGRRVCFKAAQSKFGLK